MKCLSEALKVNKTLQRLDLCCNKLGNCPDPSGLKLLSEALKVNTTLRVLRLDYNNLGNCYEEMNFLLEALKVNISIQELNLYSNNLREYFEMGGLKLLEEVLKINNSIQRICGIEYIYSDKAISGRIIDATKRNEHNHSLRNCCLFGLLLPILGQ